MTNPFKTEIARNKTNGKIFFAEFYGVGISKIKVKLIAGQEEKIIKFKTYMGNYERMN